jgi:hypothetical protein
MKKMVLLLALTAVMVLALASAALAEQHGDDGVMTATPTATTSPTAAATAQYAQYATATPTALAPTGGPQLAVPFALVAGLAMVGFGLAALVFLRRTPS